MASFTPKVKKVEPKAGANERLKLAAALIKEKGFDEALEHVQAVLAQEPDSKTALLLSGNIRLKQKKYDEAIDGFGRALKSDPLSVPACLGMGMACLKKQDYDKAIESFTNAVRIDPKSSKAYVAMGAAYLKQQQFTEAQPHLLKALRYDPQAESARVLLSQVHSGLGRTDEAVATLDQALRLNPTSVRAHLALSRIHRDRKDYPAAEEALQAALESSPPKVAPIITLALGGLYVEMDRLDEAGDLARSLPALKPLQPRVHKLWGDIYEKKGMLKEAAEEYRAANLLASDDEIDDADLDSLVESGVVQWQDLVQTQRASLTETLAAAKAKRGGQ